MIGTSLRKVGASGDKRRTDERGGTGEGKKPAGQRADDKDRRQRRADERGSQTERANPKGRTGGKEDETNERDKERPQEETSEQDERARRTGGHAAGGANHGDETSRQGARGAEQGREPGASAASGAAAGRGDDNPTRANQREISDGYTKRC